MAKKTTCLVTGGAGFIGSHVTEALLKRRYKVRVIDDFSTGFRHNLTPFKGDLSVVKGDIRKETTLAKAMKGVDYVFHLAAVRAVLRSVDNPYETHDINVTGTLKLLETARKLKVKRVINTSSSAIYGDVKHFPTKETDLPSPESPYAVSKLAAESYCQLYSKLYGLSTVSLRYFNVFGPRQNPESKYSAVIPIFIEMLLKNKSPEVHWDGKQSRDFNYVDNIAYANCIAMRGPKAHGEVYNVATNEELSVNDIFYAIREILDKESIKPKYGKKRQGDVRRTYADIKKIKRDLKFKVQPNFIRVLRRQSIGFSMAKTVVITGGAGFIGSHLCARYMDQGWNVIVIDNFLTGSRANIESFLSNERFKLIEHDLAEKIELEGDIDFILHFASPASPSDYLDYPIQTLKVGALGTHHALGIAKVKNATFLLASTSEVYGDPKIHPQPENYWGNVNPVGYRGVYDEAKRYAEALTMAYHRTHGVDTKIVRIFNTYGPGMRVNDGRAIPNFITQAIKNEPVTMYGDGHQTRSLCYIDDMVEGIDRLIHSDRHFPVNIGNPDEISIVNLVRLIIMKTESKSEKVHMPLPEDDPTVRQPDITAAREHLKWEPQVSLDEGLERTIKYFREAI